MAHQVAESNRERLEPPQARWGPRQTVALIVLAACQLMLVLDVTVVNVALPDLARSLELSRTAVPWVMTSYTLVFGGLVLLGGRVADLVGARRILVIGLVGFTVASLAAALSPSGSLLIAARVGQGLGAALLSPAALAVLTGTFSGAARAKALAVWGSLSAVGTAVGVSLGGVLTAALGWQWIFAINVPVGIAVLAALPAVTTRSDRVTTARLDVPGAALVTAGTATVVYGLVRAGEAGWSSGGTIAALAGGVLLWLAFAAVERRTREPLLRLAMLRDRSVAAGALLMIVATGLMVGDFFVGSFVLQRALEDSPLRVGLEFLPVAVGVGVGAQLGGRLLRRFSARMVAPVALGLAAVGEGAAAFSGGHRILLLAGLSVASFGIGAVFVTAFNAALATADPAEGGVRSAVVSTAHELGGAFGVAVLSTVAGTALTAVAPRVADFSVAFLVAAAAAAGGAVGAALLAPGSRRAAEPAGHLAGHPSH